MREFNEETNINPDEIEILKFESAIPMSNDKSTCRSILIPDSSFPLFIEQHKGTNGKMYKTGFLIAKSKSMKLKPISNEFQKHEIGKIEWLSFDDCINKFRSYEVEKKKLFVTAHQFIENMNQLEHDRHGTHNINNKIDPR